MDGRIQAVNNSAPARIVGVAQDQIALLSQTSSDNDALWLVGQYLHFVFSIIKGGKHLLPSRVQDHFALRSESGIFHGRKGCFVVQDSRPMNDKSSWQAIQTLVDLHVAAMHHSESPLGGDDHRNKRTRSIVNQAEAPQVQPANWSQILDQNLSRSQGFAQLQAGNVVTPLRVIAPMTAYPGLVVLNPTSIVFALRRLAASAQEMAMHCP